MKTFLETREYEADFPVSSFYISDLNFLAHWHIDVEMVLVCEGRIRIGINKESKLMGPGEAALFGSTDIHYYHSGDAHSKIIILMFRPELVGSPGGWPGDLRFNPGFIDLRQPNEPIGQVVERLFHDIAGEMKETRPFSHFYQNGRIVSVPTQAEEKKPFYQLYVTGKVLELCALALRHFPTGKAGLQPKNQKAPDIHKIQSAIQYLEKNYMRDISLSDISKKADFSPYHFSRLFHQFTGIPFYKYLTRIRIAKAEQLIKTTRKSIIDISFECGFNSVRTFNRAYKTVKGFPPSQSKLE